MNAYRRFTFQLELTTYCNLRCSFCPRSEIIKRGIRPLKNIDFSFFKFIVNRLKAFHKPMLVSLSGLGEPTLYPKLADAVLLLRSELGGETILRLNTNATMLNDEMLINSGLDVLIVGLNLATPDLYEKHTGASNYEELVRNIIRFLQVKGNRKPNVSVRMLGFGPNAPFMEESKRFWTGHLNENDEFRKTHYANWAGKIKQEPSWFSKSHTCSYLSRYITIDLDGNAYPCSYGPSETPESFLYLGNIKDRTIAELCRDERLMKLKSLHKTRVYPAPCSVCSDVIDVF